MLVLAVINLKIMAPYSVEFTVTNNGGRKNFSGLAENMPCRISAN